MADLGSRGAGIHKVETGGWFTGPEWLLDEKQWPDQPDFECTKLSGSRDRKKRVSFNHRHRKGLTLDSGRERSPDQCLVVRRVEMWYTFQNTGLFRHAMYRSAWKRG